MPHDGSAHVVCVCGCAPAAQGHACKGLQVLPCPWGMCMVMPIDMGSEINLRRTSAHAVSCVMLMCSRHEDGCMVWRMHKHHVHLHACMFVCMHAFL
jgi:hypothetical protein